MLSDDIQKFEGTDETRKIPEEQESFQFDVFISHASEDKDAVARPLAYALKKFELKVWYDEFELKIGDNLTQAILRDGLSKSRFGIVILSIDFFKKEWTRREFSEFEKRSGFIEKRIILPIWHNVTKQQVIEFSPSLADKLARNTTTHTVEEIAQEIAELIQGKKPKDWYQRVLECVVTYLKKLYQNFYLLTRWQP